MRCLGADATGRSLWRADVPRVNADRVARLAGAARPDGRYRGQHRIRREPADYDADARSRAPSPARPTWCRTSTSGSRSSAATIVVANWLGAQRRSDGGAVARVRFEAGWSGRIVPIHDRVAVAPPRDCLDGLDPSQLYVDDTTGSWCRCRRDERRRYRLSAAGARWRRAAGAGARLPSARMSGCRHRRRDDAAAPWTSPPHQGDLVTNGTPALSPRRHRHGPIACRAEASSCTFTTDVAATPDAVAGQDLS